ncbi:MAG: deoxyribonuclease [Frankiaceae bacterium]|nr:deoxyribonuclease [Frankiaceae bacterium]
MGAHVFVAGGLSAVGLPYARRIGAEAIQVFVSNPRGWAPSAGDARADEAFRASCAEAKMPVFVHAPYLINFGSPTETTRERSAASVQHSLARGRRIGARGVVVHAGSAVDEGQHDVALKVMRELVLPVLDSLGADDPTLLIEPTAGGGKPLAATVEDLEPLFAALDHHPRLGVCLDTCHAFAAGHDLATPGGVRRTLNRLVRIVGRGRLQLIHANDSKDPVGSGRDRHANIGAGMIGTEPFGELFRHPATRGVPVVIETAGDVETHSRDLATLRSLRDR